MSGPVRFRPAAEADLQRLFDYIAERSGADIALGYLGRIEGACRKLATFPNRGTRRDDLFAGLRLIGFEGRVSLAFIVDDGAVEIVRVFYGARDIDAAFDAS